MDFQYIRHKPVQWIWLIIEPFIYYYIGYYACYLTLQVIFTEILKVQVSTAELNGVYMLTGWMCILPLVKKQKQNTPKMKNHIPFKEWLLPFAVLAITSSIFLNACLNWIPFFSNSSSNQVAEKSLYSVPVIMGIFIYGLVAPIAEETLFRYLIFHRLRITKIDGKDQKSSTGIAIIFSSILFGIYHGNIVQGIYAIILGLLLAVVYVFSGKFISAVFFHAICNLCIYLLSYHSNIYLNITGAYWMVGYASAFTITLYLIYKKYKKIH